MKVTYNYATTAPSVHSLYQPPSANGAATTGYSTVTLNTNQPANQSLEIVVDSGFNSTSNAARTFNIVLNDTNTNLINWGYVVPGSVSGVSGGTHVAAAASQLPGASCSRPSARTPARRSRSASTAAGCAPSTGRDGRQWVYANFRYQSASYGSNPNSAGMDEDYDACDLENWFLAIQSADGQVVIPSFHRPGILRYRRAQRANDWNQLTPDDLPRPIPTHCPGSSVRSRPTATTRRRSPT